MSLTKSNLFRQLITDAAACNLCPAMCERRAVLSALNGSFAARVMFVAEAPGRAGGDRTRVPLSGDQSGHNFARFIASINLSREQTFITNAVLCNPRTATGANRTSSKIEINNCLPHLKRQIEIINPKVVVTLGRISLEALRRLDYHALELRRDAGQVHFWRNRKLVPLYHPSPQVLASHRREHEQLIDYQAIKLALENA